jgi:hypothetical protein
MRIAILSFHYPNRTTASLVVTVLLFGEIEIVLFCHHLPPPRHQQEHHSYWIYLPHIRLSMDVS